jgi:hypothetical protein
MLVEVRVLPAQVVAEVHRRRMEVEAARVRRAVVVEAVDDAGRDQEERSRRDGGRSVAKSECELSLDDDEPVGVMVMDVGLRSTFAGAVEELRHRELVSVHEQGRTPPGPIGDRLAFRPSRPANDDETGIAGSVLGSWLLVECSADCPELALVPCRVQAANEVAEPEARDVEIEEVHGSVPCHREGVHDLGRDEHPGLPLRPVLAVLEPEGELALEDEECLRVLRVDVERRSHAGSRADLDGAELLDVSEKRDAELAVARDALALADLREHLLHETAA